MTAHEKYFLPNSENWREPIQMQLSKKQKKISKLFPAFVKTQ